MEYCFQPFLSHHLKDTSFSQCHKASFISNVSTTYYALGWFAPCTILMKILFQKFWELKISWDDDTLPEYQGIFVVLEI